MTFTGNCGSPLPSAGAVSDSSHFARNSSSSACQIQVQSRLWSMGAARKAYQPFSGLVPMCCRIMSRSLRPDTSA